MADSDNSTTVPVVTPGGTCWTSPIARSADCELARTTTLADPVVALSQAWAEAHAATAAHCLEQQQLETALLGSSSEGVDGQSANEVGGRGSMRRAYADAKAAEALAGAREQELLERLARAPALSLAGIAAKLSVIVTEAEDNTDLADFPVAHVRSALADLRRLIGEAIVDPCLAAEDDRADVGGADLCRSQRDVFQQER